MVEHTYFTWSPLRSIVPVPFSVEGGAVSFNRSDIRDSVSNCSSSVGEGWELVGWERWGRSNIDGASDMVRCSVNWNDNAISDKAVYITEL